MVNGKRNGAVKNPFDDPEPDATRQSLPPRIQVQAETPFIDSYIKDFKKPNFGSANTKTDAPLNPFHTFQAKPVTAQPTTNPWAAKPASGTQSQMRTTNPFESLI